MGPFVLFLFTFIGVIVSYVTATLTGDVLENKMETKKQYAKEVADKILFWYQNNAYQIDSQSGPVTVPFNLDYNGVILVSNRVNCSNNVKAHIIAVVLPDVGGVQTVMDPNTGYISKGKYDIIEIVDGCSIQKQLFLLTQRKTQAVANWLENYFVAKKKADIYGQHNYFASASCGGWGDIPCVQGANAQLLINYLGGTSTDYKTAYGTDMLFDNSSSAVHVNQQPYTCRIGFITPWGDTHWTVATGQL